MARDAGLTRDDLRSAAMRRLRHGVYCSVIAPATFELDCAAVLLVAPRGSRIAGVSAARLLGLPVERCDRIHVSISSGTQFRDATAVVHHHPVADTETVQLETSAGLLHVSSPMALAREAARGLGLVEAVVLLDASRHRWPGRFEAILDTWSQAPGSPGFLREAARLSCPGAESAMESRMRLLLVLAGLPTPVTQHPVVIDGRRRRFDLAYPQLKVAMEYDGSHHFASEQQKHDDAVRREGVIRAGWVVVTVVSHGIYRRPAETIDRVVAACADRGATFVPSPRWLAHFMQR